VWQTRNSIDPNDDEAVAEWQKELAHAVTQKALRRALVHPKKKTKGAHRRHMHTVAFKIEVLERYAHLLATENAGGIQSALQTTALQYKLSKSCISKWHAIGIAPFKKRALSTQKSAEGNQTKGGRAEKLPGVVVESPCTHGLKNL
jgi:hypothetical protein